MQLNLDERKATLSVREFAEFRIGPTDSGFGRSGRWRAEIGQRWHREMQTQTLRKQSQAIFEVPIKGHLWHKKWRIELQGRIDQLIDEGEIVRIREIKSVNMVLPQEQEDLETTYSSYFVQLAAYLALAAKNSDWKGKSIVGELVFVDIADGVTQEVSLGTETRVLLFEQLERLHDFLEERWNSRKRLRRMEFQKPFPDLRAGQEYTQEQLNFFLNKPGPILFEAPTGFGKTGMALEFALTHLREGLFDRVIYLTGKATGQWQAISQVRQMVIPSETLQFFQMRSKTNHAIASPMHTCDNGVSCRNQLEERWEKSGISPARLFTKGTVDLEEIKTLGTQTGVCPYEISRTLLPFADVWVGDYNYVFSPRNRGVFFNQPGFDSTKTLLIVDEAHNLPSRVAGAYSCFASAQEADAVEDELRFAGCALSILHAWKNYARFLHALEPVERIDLNLEYELADLLDTLDLHLQGCRFDPVLISTKAWEGIWKIAEMRSFLENAALEKLLWVRKKETLNLTCLDAAPEIALTLNDFGKVIMMSATLSPIDYFQNSCGLGPEKINHLKAETPWRDSAYSLAIDARVDTRYKSRERYYAATAETAIHMRMASVKPLAMFFPSYRYAENIGKYLAAARPDFRLALQPRGIGLEEQAQFLDESLASSDIILLVMGSGFSESVDLLGGRITHALVVGPALPEVNAEQKARMEDRSHLPRETAFRQVYQAPGMVKINQALGRLVRAPGQKAQVLLHCRRFAETSYNELLDKDYRNAVVLKNEASLLNWLTQSQDGFSPPSDPVV